MNEVKQIIARIPGWSQARNLKVERIEGLTNMNYRVTVDGERYVLRVSGENTARLGINRSHEFVALENAAEAGIGPAARSAHKTVTLDRTECGSRVAKRQRPYGVLRITCRF